MQRARWFPCSPASAPWRGRHTHPVCGARTRAREDVSLARLATGRHCLEATPSRDRNGRVSPFVRPGIVEKPPRPRRCLVTTSSAPGIPSSAAAATSSDRTTLRSRLPSVSFFNFPSSFRGCAAFPFRRGTAHDRLPIPNAGSFGTRDRRSSPSWHPSWHRRLPRFRPISTAPFPTETTGSVVRGRSQLSVLPTPSARFGDGRDCSRRSRLAPCPLRLRELTATPGTPWSGLLRRVVYAGSRHSRPPGPQLFGAGESLLAVVLAPPETVPICLGRFTAADMLPNPRRFEDKHRPKTTTLSQVYSLRCLVTFLSHRLLRGGPRRLLHVGLFCLALVVLTGVLPQRLSEVVLGATCTTIWRWDSTPQPDKGGGLRIVLFGEHDIATPERNGIDGSTGPSWTEVLCQEVCRRALPSPLSPGTSTLTCHDST